MIDQAEMSDAERSFLTQWAWIGGPPPDDYDTEFYPGRKWRADFVWRAAKVIVEIDGIFRTGKDRKGKSYAGRHLTPKGFNDDCYKLNAAVRAGYIPFRVTTTMLNAQDWQELEAIADFIKERCNALEHVDTKR